MMLKLIYSATQYLEAIIYFANISCKFFLENFAAREIT